MKALQFLKNALVNYKYNLFYKINGLYSITNHQPTPTITDDESFSRKDLDVHLSQLFEYGYTSFSANEFISTNCLSQLDLQYQAFESNALKETTRKKDYEIKESYSNIPYKSDDSLLNLATEPFLINLLYEYFKVIPRLNHIDRWLTLPSKDNLRKFSQNWHRDPEAFQLIKLFYYHGDVLPENGPFQYCIGTHKFGKNAHLFPSKSARSGSHPSESEINNSNVKIFTGTVKKGTIILCDTHGIHRGGFVETGNRMISHLVFSHPGTIFKRRFSIKGNIENQFLNKMIKNSSITTV